MISQTLSIVSVAVLVCVAQGYRTGNAELQKDNASSKDEFSDIKLAFSVFDKDNSGHINEEELKEVLTAIGQAPTESQLKEIVKLADNDGDGEISLSEFAKVAKEYKDVDLTLKKTFEEVDTDGTGFISDEELHAWLKKLGKKLSEEEIGQMIREVDENEDNQIHFSEFIELVKKLTHDDEDDASNEEFEDVKLAFSAFDKDNSGHINKKELKEVLTAIGHAPIENQLNEIVKLADKDGNGEISLSEFAEVAKEYKDIDLTLRKTFEEIDTDGTGFISDEELQVWLTKLGKKLSEQEIGQMIKEVDENADDQIHFSEFIELVKNLS